MVFVKKDGKECIETALYGGKITVKFYPGSHQYWVNGGRKTGVTTFIGIKDKSTALVSWATEIGADFLLEKLVLGEVITEKDILEAQDLHRVRKEQAADIGTIIHDWCEKYIKFKLKKKGYDTVPAFPEDKNAQIGVNAFLDWEKEHKVKFISSERVVYSKKHDYIGTLDIEAKVDGMVCLVDLKSSNCLYNTVRMQTAGYVKADEEERKKKVYGGRWAIRLAKETEEEYMVRMKKKQAKDVKKGKEPREIAPYQIFEAMFFDEKAGAMEYDFDAYLACVKLTRWDRDTDFFYQSKK